MKNLYLDFREIRDDVLIVYFEWNYERAKMIIETFRKNDLITLEDQTILKKMIVNIEMTKKQYGFKKST